MLKAGHHKWRFAGEPKRAKHWMLGPTLSDGLVAL